MCAKRTLMESKEHNKEPQPKRIKRAPILSIKVAASLLRANEVVAFPTETVYGLGGNAFSDEAVAKIFSAKGRPSDNPLIVHVSKLDEVKPFVKEITPLARKLGEKLWPGPLSIIFPLRDSSPRPLSALVTAGLRTVAVRIPNHPVALELLRAVQLPIAAPSANTSGRPSPTSAEHVMHDLGDKIAGIVEGGCSSVGMESTVVLLGENPKVTILRPGGCTLEQIAEIVGKDQVVYDKSMLREDSIPMAPGMKYRHYAPQAPLTLTDCSDDDFRKLLEKHLVDNASLGVIVTREHSHLSWMKANDHVEVVVVGSRGPAEDTLKEVAANIFGALRKLDNTNVVRIFSESFPLTLLGFTIMNRLKKAAER